MAAQKEVSTYITLFGKVDSSFNEISRKLKSFGNSVSSVGAGLTMISAPIAAATKASLGLFSDYDDVMRRIQAVGKYSDEQMTVVSNAARRAGAETRYMALDAGEAMLYLTQAGVDLDGTLQTLPNLLNAAAAGNMELATASDLLISNIYSLGKSFNDTDVSQYIDAVSTAADATNTTLEEIMEGVSKIGGAGRMYGGGTNELLAILGLLANVNLKGSTGGINARNMIISLLAPTKKASELMAELSISEEELNDALTDYDVNASAEAMEQLGLKTVDANGKVRPMIDILTDLNAGLEGLGDDEKANILYNIFGKRTYAAVSSVLQTLDQYPELLQKIENSTGSAQEKAEILEGGIGGATRRAKSALQELGLAWGDATDEVAIEYMQTFTDIALTLSETLKDIDPDTMGNIIDTLTGIVLVGPGLMIAGKAISAVGDAFNLLSTPTGKILTLALAIGALSAAADAWNAHEDAEFMSERFGTLEIDAEKAQKILDGYTEKYKERATELQSYADSITTASEAYTTATGELSSGVLEAYFAQTELTETDKNYLQTLAGTMTTELKTALNGQKLLLSDVIDTTYSEEGDTEKNEGWSNLIDSIFGGLDEKANSAGAELRSALTKALKDGKLDEDEKDAIRASQERMNRIMAEIAGYNAKLQASYDYNKALYMNPDSLEEALALTDQAAETAENAVAEKFLWLRAAVDVAEQEGAALNENLIDAYGLKDAYDYKGARAAILLEQEEAQQRESLGIKEMAARLMSSYYDPFSEELSPFYDLISSVEQGNVLDWQGAISGPLQELFTTTAYGFKDADTWEKFVRNIQQTAENKYPLEELLADMDREIETQGYVTEGIYNQFRDRVAGELFSMGTAGWGDQTNEAVYGENGLISLVDYYHDYVGRRPVQIPVALDPNTENVDQIIQDAGAPAEPLELEVNVTDNGEAEAYGENIKGEIENTAAQLTVEAPDGAADGLAYATAIQGELDENPSEYRIQIADDGYYAVDAQQQPVRIPAVIEPEQESAQQILEGLGITGEPLELTVTVGDNGEITSISDKAQGAMDANVPRLTVEVPDGAADGAAYASAIQGALDGNPGVYHIQIVTDGGLPTGGGGSSKSSSKKSGSSSSSSKSSGSESLFGFAEGGRSDVPAIFGEGSAAEWAIPEEHTQRTAELLASAAKASGFTASEIIARTGGLNGGTTIAPQFVYAPTIYAQNAEGVSEALAANKEAMEEWFEEKMREQERVSYS